LLVVNNHQPPGSLIYFRAILREESSDALATRPTIHLRSHLLCNCVQLCVRAYTCASCVCECSEVNETKLLCPKFAHKQRLVAQSKRMSPDQKIADIKRQLGEAVNRIENIQGGRQQPLLSKISSHFRTQGSSIVNVVLTASVFAVAFGRLQQKQQHEARTT